MNSAAASSAQPDAGSNATLAAAATEPTPAVVIGGAGLDHDVVVPIARVPSVSGEWIRLDLPSGWLVFNMRLSRVDAHCGVHDLCRSNKVMKKAPIGYQLYGLSLTPGTSMKDHQELKHTAGKQDTFPARQVARVEFQSLADVNGGFYHDLLACEAECRQDNRLDEPEVVPWTVLLF